MDNLKKLFGKHAVNHIQCDGNLDGSLKIMIFSQFQSAVAEMKKEEVCNNCSKLGTCEIFQLMDKNQFEYDKCYCSDFEKGE